MSQPTKPGQVVFIVLLTNGNRIAHKYDIPLDPEEAEKSIERITDMLIAALVTREVPSLFFQNPSILYNRDNVLGVEYKFVSLEELEQFTGRLNRKMGLVKD